MDVDNKLQNSSITTLGFLKYFQNLLGYHFYVYLVFNFIVGLLDGIGLAMFIPLMGVATNSTTNQNSLGKLDFLPRWLESIGLPLTLTNVLFIMVVIFSVKGILSYIRQLYFIRLRLGAISNIRLQLIDGLRSLSYRGYTQSDPGKIQFSMIGEAGRLVIAMTNFVTTVQNLVVLMTYILLAFLTNWQFAILVAIGGVLSNFLYKIINSLTKTEAKKLSLIGNRFNLYLIQTIQNFKYLKATNSFKIYESNLKKEINEFELSQFKIGKLNAIAANLREPIIILIIALVMIVQIRFLGGDFPSIMVGLLLFYRALNYLVAMQNSWNLFTGNSAGLDAIVDLQNEFNQFSEPKQTEKKTFQISTIELKDVDLVYGDSKILNDISLTIKPKTTIALVGESGAGKTSLANVLGGLIDVNQGEFIINGSELNNSQLNAYRDRVGYIAQEPVIFADTIFNNVTFWDEKTPENISRFFYCMKLVHLQDFVYGLAEQENSQLGNNGILISGGQKQRISIARELYRDVDLLIMDEATSALDSETEKIIQKNIEDLHGKYTIIIIAHRLSTIKNADEIYVMDKGKVINSGSFNDLYFESRAFKRMVDLQEV